MNSINNRKVIKIIICVILLVGIFFTMFVIFREINNTESHSSILKDDNFRKAVEESLGYDGLTEDDIKSIKVLKLEDFNLDNRLEDLKLFTNLEELYINNCAISSFDNVIFPSKLKILDCSNNNLLELDFLEYGQFENLEKLVVDYNPIYSLLIDSSKLKNLKILSAQNCKISGGLKLDAFSILEELYLDGNSISSIEGNIHKLNVLSVDDNNFSNVRNLSDLSNLKKLYISGNRLTTIDGIDEIEDIEVLDIRDNNIVHVNELSRLTRLHSIYMDKNIDRKEVDFLYNRWRNGDQYTKKYMLEKRYDLNKESIKNDY